MSVTSWFNRFVVIALVVMTLGCERDADVSESLDTSRTYLEQGQFHEALVEINRGLEHHPNNQQLRFLQGEALLSLGEGGRAQIAFERAASLGVAEVQILPNLARSLLLQEKPRQALATVDGRCQEFLAQTRAAECWLVRAEAMQSLTDDKKTLLAYIDVFRFLDSHKGTNGSKTAQRLARLAEASPLIKGAQQHVHCQKSATGTSANLAINIPETALRVGPERDLQLPSQAAAIASDDDVILIESGLYDDVAVWRANNLKILGDGRVRIESRDRVAENKGIWVVKGDNTVIENVEISGAKSTHRNGSGIRLEGNNLVVRNSKFYNNENGILSAKRPESVIVIEGSEFYNNGFGDGYSHNLYIGVSKSLTVTGTYSHGAIIGHQLKSRAQQNFIYGNKFADDLDGNSSYIIDLPHAGHAEIAGNIIQQGHNAVNRTLLSFGAERQDPGRLSIYHNTFFSSLDRSVFVKNYADTSAQVYNNIFAGARGIRLDGSGTLTNNHVSVGGDFVDVGNLNFELVPGSTAIDAVEPSSDLRQFRSELGSVTRPRVWLADLGALEFCGY